MQVIARLQRDRHLCWLGGIAKRGIEIEYGIERAARANPFVDGFAYVVPLIRVVAGAFVGGDGCAVDLHAPLMSARDELLVAGDHGVRSRLVRALLTLEERRQRPALELAVRDAEVV